MSRTGGFVKQKDTSDSFFLKGKRERREWRSTSGECGCQRGECGYGTRKDTSTIHEDDETRRGDAGMLDPPVQHGSLCLLVIYLPRTPWPQLLYCTEYVLASILSMFRIIGAKENQITPDDKGNSGDKHVEKSIRLQLQRQPTMVANSGKSPPFPY